ncbi:MAG: hypothetical protein SFU27_03805, partial [Thermonemataceae bacterium]|nr:hypothetical protein [Thermonemataceae bacterium]
LLMRNVKCNVYATYSSCVEQPAAKTFVGMMTIIAFLILVTDAVNAYGQSDGPTVPTFIRLCDAFTDVIFGINNHTLIY